MTQPSLPRKPIVLGPGEGRTYPMGRIDAVFKADGAETGAGYSISEWWLEPHTAGPGPHSHPEDDMFYVIAGTMSVLVGDRVDARRRGFVRAHSRRHHARFRESRRRARGRAQLLRAGDVRRAHAGDRALVAGESAEGRET